MAHGVVKRIKTPSEGYAVEDTLIFTRLYSHHQLEQIYIQTEHTSINKCSYISRVCTILLCFSQVRPKKLYSKMHALHARPDSAYVDKVYETAQISRTQIRQTAQF